MLRSAMTVLISCCYIVFTNVAMHHVIEALYILNMITRESSHCFSAS